MHFETIWQYIHQHWQDNVIAGAIWATLGYLYGRFHVKRLHGHLDNQDIKAEAMHKHIREIHAKVHNA